MNTVYWKDLGLKSYGETWELQEQHLQKVMDLKILSRTEPALSVPHYFLFVEHPPVFTLGKSGSESHLLASDEELRLAGVDFFKTNRGGDITFHGPGQVVGYPIFDLDQIYTDIHRYLRDMEQAIIDSLAEFGIRGGRKEGLTGVWVGEEKICAMGVRASRWITMHGFALNVNNGLHYFDMIVPCGIRDKGVTSMKKILGREVDIQQVKDLIRFHFERIFSLTFQAYES
jgi:lipoyl(octanoyl) transferase